MVQLGACPPGMKLFMGLRGNFYEANSLVHSELGLLQESLTNISEKNSRMPEVALRERTNWSDFQAGRTLAVNPVNLAAISCYAARYCR